MEYEYKVIFDDGKPFEVFCNSEYSLKKTLMDFYLSQKQVKNENYNAYVFNNKDEDISESQFIEEMIADILDGEAITTKIQRSENENIEYKGGYQELQSLKFKAYKSSKNGDHFRHKIKKHITLLANYLGYQPLFYGYDVENAMNNDIYYNISELKDLLNRYGDMSEEEIMNIAKQRWNNNILKK